jgi:aryl-alcohol dehydrogenase-like predicted oxidoreductase
VLRAAFDAAITVFDTADAYDAGRRTPRTNEHRAGHEPAVSNPTLRKEMRGRTPHGPKVLSWAN